MFKIAALLYPHALATSVTLPMEIMHAASQLASLARRGQPQVRFQLAASDRRQMRLASGLTVKPDISYAELEAVDLLLLPAIWRNPLTTVRLMRPWFDLLREQHAAGTRICSVGTGSYLLADAGLLAGRHATTHWHYLEPFSERYPEVELKHHHLITQSDNIYCVGSVNSIADLMVHMVEEWFGAEVARAIENQFSPEIRRPFQAAAYQNEADSAHRDEVIAQAQDWLRANMGGTASIEALSQALQMQPRTLNRRFKKATGLTPVGYLQTLRMNSARELLKHSNLSVGDIAWQVGLQDVSYFSQLFRRHNGVSPLRYRSAVRGKLFVPAES